MIKMIEAREDGIREIQQLIEDRTSEDLTPYREQVFKIIENVRCTKDMAVREYTRRFDHIDISKENLLVRSEEIDEACSMVEDKFMDAISLAKERILKYHQAQKVTSWSMNEDNGIIMGQICRPLQRVGVYVPGGSAAYPSSVLMTVIPAKVAGVEEVVMVTPPDLTGKVNPYILAAAKIAGVDKIYKVGGAQAVAALAYGTETIPKVDKIVGPGNIYVSLAKQLVYGQVDIDMIAGPSEILIIADETASPRYVAADLLSQAEHDPLAAAILVTSSKKIGEEVQKEVERQMKSLPRFKIIQQSLQKYGRIILVDSLEEGIEIANQIAPEHLELAVSDPFLWMTKVKNAGAIFLGEFSPEPLGDYMAGPNHVLPTNGTARFFSPLSVRDYLKYSSYLSYSQEALEEVKDQVIIIAEKEGLEGHANAIRVRFEDGEVRDDD